jgi:ParB family chromosome partitioning protein
MEIPLDRLDANPYQTRTSLDEKSLDELADSISSLGLLEPIVVRPKNGRYQVIAGERRVKACYLAGMHKIPAVVREVTDEQAAEMTVIENLQREDINPMDQARGFRRLISEFGLTPDQIAERTGKGNSTVLNSLRLLHLPEPVQDKVQSGALTAGHAKALLGLDGQPPEVMLEFAERAASLSVRKTERLVAQFLAPDKDDPTIEPGRWLRPNLRKAEQQLTNVFATKVTITENWGEGAIHVRIAYHDLWKFERLFATLTGQTLTIAYPPREKQAGDE